jgi:hypothetical protein
MEATKEYMNLMVKRRLPVGTWHQRFDDARSLGQAGALFCHQEARDRQPGIHLAGSRIALYRDVTGALAMDREYILFQQVLFDRGWIPPRGAKHASCGSQPVCSSMRSSVLIIHVLGRAVMRMTVCGRTNSTSHWRYCEVAPAIHICVVTAYGRVP